MLFLTQAVPARLTARLGPAVYHAGEGAI